MFTASAERELGQEQHSTTGWQQQGQRVICRSPPITRLAPGEPAGVIIDAPLVTRGWGADAETATTANPNTQMAIIQFRASSAAPCNASMCIGAHKNVEKVMMAIIQSMGILHHCTM